MPIIFSQQQLAQIVEQTITPAVRGPFTHVVVGTIDPKGAQVVVAFKNDVTTGFQWEVQGVGRHDWNGDDTIGAKVILKW